MEGRSNLQQGRDQTKWKIINTEEHDNNIAWHDSKKKHGDVF